MGKKKFIKKAKVKVEKPNNSTELKATYLFNEGNELFAAKEYKAAIIKYTEAIKLNDSSHLDENSLMANFRKGKALHELARQTKKTSTIEKLLEAAYDCFSKVIEHDPNDDSAYFQRANILVQLSYPIEAKQDLNVARSLNKASFKYEANNSLDSKNSALLASSDSESKEADLTTTSHHDYDSDPGLLGIASGGYSSDNT